jgi:hypothetical protein
MDEEIGDFDRKDNLGHDAEFQPATSHILCVDGIAFIRSKFIETPSVT